MGRCGDDVRYAVIPSRDVGAPATHVVIVARLVAVACFLGGISVGLLLAHL